ncbi:peptide/nickel transport system ATP-binding protein [Paenibacillus algorifonticola]|uniref:Peptide/nickel transport system ATP-binding protein n=1 Tax=Paenibacillus algorifonticola TaxID=684063 RepID=A0A1I1YKM5_9BACL|nr:dipeptide/oligopeptide/nickel ABC transporter ATP-binding protein [Paenibacillus algorifonticola]SFE19852.1 peptide/nickel transport system ATP-binding protein [Paenibacillus algorifonticola]
MQPLLRVERLYKTFRKSKEQVYALKEISLQIARGECLGVVGESGSGKSTLGKVILALERPDSGEVWLDDVPLLQLKGAALREQRQHVQVVFQDPNASLNSKMPIWRSIMEPLDNFPDVMPPFLSGKRTDRIGLAAQLLELVGLPLDHLARYPHELSGGQRQRVAIARGISLNPKLLVCDEPTSSLDVSVQAQILQLLKSLKQTLGMSYLFISHDIASVQYMSDRMIVMKDGEMIDEFASSELTHQDRHIYTKLLVEAAS